jgi:hypothetical protein
LAKPLDRLIDILMANSAEDIRRWEAAAAKGDLASQHLLALALRAGDGIAADKERGTTLLFEAAEKGEKDAMASVGVAYYFGDGVPKNHRLAMKWYLAGAAAGSAYGVCNVGDLFDDSDEFPKNPVEAMAWFVCSLDQIDAAWDRMRLIAGQLSEQGLDTSALRAKQIYEALRAGGPLELTGDFNPASAPGEESAGSERGPVTLLSFLARFHHYCGTNYSAALLRHELLKGESSIYLPAADPLPGEPELGAGQMRLGCLGKDEQERTALFVFDDAILAREKFGREKSYAVPPSTLRELIGKLGVQRVVLNAGLPDAWICDLHLDAPAAATPPPVKDPEDPEGYYKLLGVRPSATGIQVMEAYERFKKKHENDQEALSRGEAAYAVLRDLFRRAEYNKDHSERTKIDARNARSIEDAFALARSEEARRAYLPENNGLGFDDLSRARNTGSSCALPFVLFLATMAWVLW